MVVFEKSSGRMLSGSKAPTMANLEQWLKAHPTFEVYRPRGKIVTSKVSWITEYSALSRNACIAFFQQSWNVKYNI